MELSLSTSWNRFCLRLRHFYKARRQRAMVKNEGKRVEIVEASPKGWSVYPNYRLGRE